MDNGFQLLSPLIQKWVYKQGWPDLREIQKKSIKPILSEKTDVVISAATAAGKTEAAFLPACTAILNLTDSVGILYISPLKALINDQLRRLEGLCKMLDMPVTAWHGDSSRSKKKQCKKDPRGIILITPESLESLLIRDSGWVRSAFGSLKFIIIDEYHAFIGSERGCQLQSLMHRLECLLERETTPIPRIALSATLGDMDDKVADYLRPNKTFPWELIKCQDSETSFNLKVKIKGYVNKPSEVTGLNETEYAELILSANQQIAQDLYRTLRGRSNLVFANSRTRTEQFAVMLGDMCSYNNVMPEFFPHHGSLSKELRVDLESRLQKENIPTTAICTMTLELGIDIGKVESVAQITAPHSVASLRQRIGRSGRRGDSAILRMYITENELSSDKDICDKLRMELLQSIAMIHLLVKEKWCEPADIELYHFSTLLHQVLAIIAQWGGVRADQLWSVLCASGTFKKVTIAHFKALLSQMGELQLITQLTSGELVLAINGEKLVDHYTFYAVFKTPEEYRVLHQGKSLGTLPIDSMVLATEHIVFGGRRWKIIELDSEKKLIVVKPAKGGSPPNFSGGAGVLVHDKVRQEMYKIYQKGDYKINLGKAKIDFLDGAARELFFEGLSYFRNAKLEHSYLFSHGQHVYIVPWKGDKIVNTLAMFLLRERYKVSCYGGIIEIENSSEFDVQSALKKIATDKVTTESDLAQLIRDKITEKYDHLLPETLLLDGYGVKTFDVLETQKWLVSLVF